MEPNQNVQNNMQTSAAGVNGAVAGVNVAAGASAAPEAPKENIMAQGASEKKNGKGMLIGLILCLLLAAGGICFGVWAMMDGNSQVAKKDEQISALKTQINELSEDNSGISVMEESETIIENVNKYSNPVISSTSSRDGYIVRVSFSSSMYNGEGGNKGVRIAVKDGNVETCDVEERLETDGLGGSTRKVSDCEITGLDGSISRIVEFGSGQDSGFDRIGFILSDGTVKYTLPLHEAVNNSDFSIKGSLSVDKYVVDTINTQITNITTGYGGYSATMFVFNDGTYKEFDESMLGQ